MIPVGGNKIVALHLLPPLLLLPGTRRRKLGLVPTCLPLLLTTRTILVPTREQPWLTRRRTTLPLLVLSNLPTTGTPPQVPTLVDIPVSLMTTCERKTPRLTLLLKPLVMSFMNAFRERPVTPEVGTRELSRAPTEADALRWPTETDRCRRSTPLKCLERPPVALLIIRLSKTPLIAPRTIPVLPLLQLWVSREKLRKLR